MLEKLPGVASADADKTTRSATVVYDKSVFDAKSLGDEGRYKFQLREDSAADGNAAATDDGSADGEDEQEDSSMIKIEDAPAETSSEDAGSDILPSLDGPAS